MLEALCTGARCLVVGSAPEMQFPKTEWDVVLAANGGVSVARLHGVNVDVLVTTAYLCRESGHSQPEFMALRSWRRRSFHSVWADVTEAPVTNVLSQLEKLHVGYGSICEVTKAVREDIVQRASGLALGWSPDPSKRISTGVFAACLAVASGAKSVDLVGISLTSGHAIVAGGGDSPRHHIPADKLCLEKLRASA